jgi:hypothetical protein
MEDAEGVTIAFRERDGYVGLADPIPTDLLIDCPRCKGDGEDPERFIITRGYYNPVVIAAGTYGAMEFIMEQEGEKDCLNLLASHCLHCGGEGEIDIARKFESLRDEAAAIEAYVKADRGARAAYVFDTGNHGEATAVVYVTDDDWTDPQGAAKAWAEEYQSWAEGDIWGIVHGSPYSEEESCWGYIGEKNAEAEALGELLREIEYAAKVREERRELNTIRGEN